VFLNTVKILILNICISWRDIKRRSWRMNFQTNCGQEVALTGCWNTLSIGSFDNMYYLVMHKTPGKFPAGANAPPPPLPTPASAHDHNGPSTTAKYFVIIQGIGRFLANVNSCSCSLYVVVRPSVVCNVRAPYSGYWNFRQCFYAIWYIGHLWPFDKNFTEIVPGEPLRRGVKPKGVSKI